MRTRLFTRFLVTATTGLTRATAVSGAANEPLDRSVVYRQTNTIAGRTETRDLLRRLADLREASVTMILLLTMLWFASSSIILYDVRINFFLPETCGSVHTHTHTHTHIYTTAHVILIYTCAVSHTHINNNNAFFFVFNSVLE